MKVKDIAAQIEKIVPLGLAQNWDNVGLLLGSEDKNVKRVLLTIDITADVLAEDQTGLLELGKTNREEALVQIHIILLEGDGFADS